MLDCIQSSYMRRYKYMNVLTSDWPTNQRKIRFKYWLVISISIHLDLKFNPLDFIPEQTLHRHSWILRTSSPLLIVYRTWEFSRAAREKDPQDYLQQVVKVKITKKMAMEVGTCSQVDDSWKYLTPLAPPSASFKSLQRTWLKCLLHSALLSS